ncbi:cholesterol 25-hydroxylase-like protein [Astyanax mexicanus]|uniref:Cholesterol 25-hydroxylase-like protein n=1 Tax=Astyanax mexicanus TaxID=7994 RepID=A0A8T2KWH2_ASTMX|nr:cholesterol 25-hydroxylase-like protein [Astyanax mexicanus]
MCANASDALAPPQSPLLQPVWDALRARPALLLSPVAAACAALCAHLCFSAPFLLLELLRVHRYRIGGEARAADPRRWLRCLARIAGKYAAAVLPLAALVQQLDRGSAGENREAPPLFRALSDCFTCLLVFDTLFFAAHYTLHRNPWLFQKFHRSHHVHRDTFALAAQDSSIEELLFQQVLAFSSARLVGCHPMSEILFHLLNVWLAVEDHCGYDFPWAAHRLLPCFGGPPFHHAHHQHFRGNYAPYFRHWDLIFGTSLPNCMEESETGGPAH